MKKQHPESRLLIEPINPEPVNRPARVHVRYVGFEGIDAGRRLTFSVLKPLRHESVEITFEISDALFKDASGDSRCCSNGVRKIDRTVGDGGHLRLK